MKHLRTKIMITFLVVIYTILTLANVLDYYGEGVMRMTSPSFSGFLQFATGVYISTLPVALALTAFLFFFLTPIHRTALLYESGQEPSQEMVETTRKRIRQLPRIIIIVDFTGFAVGTVATMSTNQPHYFAAFFTPMVLFYVTFILTGSFIYAFTQNSLNNIILAPLREALAIHHFEADRQHEMKMSRKILFFIGLLSIYILAFFVHKQLVGFEVLSTYAGTVEQAVQSDVSIASLQEEYAVVVAPGGGTPAFPVIDQRSLMEGRAGFLILAFFIFLTIGVGSGIILTRDFASQLKVQNRTLRAIQSGELSSSSRISITHFDEIGALSDAINSFMDSFQDLLRSVVASTRTVTMNTEELDQKTSESSAAMEEIAASVKQISTLATTQKNVAVETSTTMQTMDETVVSIVKDLQRQQSFVEETSSAMNQMAGSIRSVSENAGQVEKVADKLRELSQEGGRSITQTKETMARISESSGVVQEIVSVLQNVAAQTNLLAMNAAIEAAHAGSAGRGFAVVAGEIRKLAENSSDQSKEIIEQINTMNVRIDQGLAMSEETGRAFEGIEEGIERTVRLVKEVAAATQEQRSGANQIIEEVNAVVEGNTELTELVDALKQVSADIRRRMQSLLEASEEVTEATEQQNVSNETILELVLGVRKNAERNLTAVTELSSQVNRFDV